ncbi:MAG: family 10 glycosylhydrolase, partial [Oscillospiraceae bacterium]
MKKKITLTIFIIITIILTVLIWIFFFGKESETAINPQRNVAQMEMPPFDFNFNTQSEIESSTVQSVSSSQKSEQASFDNTQSIKDLKGIWLSYIDIKALILNKTEDEFKNEFNEACKLIRSIGLNTLIIQVRPFSDAIYKSKIYPWSHILTGKQGQDPGYDPLNIIIKIAKENNLAVHAWINPYRIKTSDIELAENNPAKAYLLKEETKNK